MKEMRSKSGNGEGSIFREKNGKWRASLTITLPDGTKKRPCKRCTTRREADEWLTKMKADVQAGKPVLSSDITFGEFIEEWLQKYGFVSIRDSTRTAYLGYLKHIQRHRIKDIKMKDLTVDILQEFFLFLIQFGRLDTKGPLSSKSLQNILNMIHKALEHAVGRNLIYQNFADFVELPKVNQPQIRVLTETEIQKIVEAMQGNPLQIALILMLFGGLRLGECCALRHDDVRCENGIWFININKSLNRTSNFGAKPGEPKTILQIQATKTSKGKRQVPLLPEVAEKVTAHMAWQRAQAEKSCGMYEANPYLVSNALGRYLDPGTVRKRLKAVAESIGITDFHPHCLRHTYASQAVKCGVPLPYLSDILGHESTAFTAKVYISLDLEGRANAQSTMSEFVKNILK